MQLATATARYNAAFLTPAEKLGPPPRGLPCHFRSCGPVRKGLRAHPRLIPKREEPQELQLEHTPTTLPATWHANPTHKSKKVAGPGRYPTQTPNPRRGQLGPRSPTPKPKSKSDLHVMPWGLPLHRTPPLQPTHHPTLTPKRKRGRDPTLKN